MSAPESFKRGGVKLHSPQNLPQCSRGIGAHGIHKFCSPKPPLLCFCFHFCTLAHSLQVSALSLGSLAFHWCIFSALNCLCLAKFMRQFMMNSCFDLLKWGAAWNGRRPMVYSEIIGHVTLPPFPTFSCLNVHPPSARWNASMAFAHDFVKFCLWNKCMHVGLPFILSMWAVL